MNVFTSQFSIPLCGSANSTGITAVSPTFIASAAISAVVMPVSTLFSYNAAVSFAAFEYFPFFETYTPLIFPPATGSYVFVPDAFS